MPITRSDVVTQLERGLRVGFLKGQRSYSPMRSAFVEESSSDGAFEIYGDMGAIPWPVQNGGQPAGTGTDPRTGVPQVGGLHEGGPVTILGGNERGLVVYNTGWEIVIGIHHDAINDNRVGNLDQWARTAGQRFEQHKDFLAFDALNKGEGTTYGNGYDGKPFFAATHVDPGAEYQTVQNNALSLQLSYPNFKSAYINASKFLDDRGQPVGLFHNLLIHAVDLVDEASQIAENPEKPGTGDRERNPFNGEITRLSAPGGWLDTSAWFLTVSQPGMKPLGLQEREAPRLVFWDNFAQGGGGIRYYKWYGRYQPFYRDWRSAIRGNT